MTYTPKLLDVLDLAKRAAELRAEAQGLDDQITAIRSNALAVALKENADLRSTLAAAAPAIELQADLERTRAVIAADPYEYTRTKGPRTAWDGEPDLTKEGWELDPNRGRPGQSWERFDYHEEMYWRRLKSARSVPEVSQMQKAPEGASATTDTTSL